MQRYDIEGEFVEFVPDDNGDYVKFADIPPVPNPLPWLDQPDTDGNWLFLPDGTSEVFACHLHSETGTRFMMMGVEISAYKGKWQRIPQPTLPGEDQS